VKGEAFLQTEQQLLRSFSDGNTSAADILVARYEDRLYNLCFKLTLNRHEAEDLYQQTWLKVLQSPKMFFPKSFQNWLYTICLNVYRDICRKNTLRGRFIAEDAEDKLPEIASPSGSAESEAVDSITQALLMSKVDRLPDKLRLPILLCYFEDLDYREIAQVLGLPVGTVKSRLNTAKKSLRTEMESELDV
jgi:RNA polymerase sigma-70 factor (ECF subfamily)